MWKGLFTVPTGPGQVSYFCGFLFECEVLAGIQTVSSVLKGGHRKKFSLLEAPDAPGKRCPPVCSSGGHM